MIKQFVLICAVAVVVPFLYGKGTEPKLHPAHLNPRVTGEWRDSADRKLSICFSTEKTTLGFGEDPVVRCWVRNNSDDAMTVLLPFGDGNFALSAGLTIQGPSGLIEYRGATKEYVLGTSDFIQLQAKSVVEQTLVLPSTSFPDMKEPGLYIIGYMYQSGTYPRPEPPANFWQGHVQSAGVPLLVSGKAK